MAPCLHQEVWVTSQILTKLGVFAVPMVLTTYTNLLPDTQHPF